MLHSENTVLFTGMPVTILFLKDIFGDSYVHTYHILQMIGFPPLKDAINANRGLNLYRRLGPRRGTPHPRWETPRVLGLWPSRALGLRAVAGGDGTYFSVVQP